MNNLHYDLDESETELESNWLDYLAGAVCLVSILTCAVYAVLFCLVNLGWL